ncbi:hypothetical protein UB41_14290 [Photobacterium phosphoreum]|nr:hypothetical protein [Photobacterium phosphoreum]KJF85723.1 hypothetical protein UB41_14290 [Photobacterium phosphoreum]
MLILVLYSWLVQSSIDHYDRGYYGHDRYDRGYYDRVHGDACYWHLNYVDVYFLILVYHWLQHVHQ